MSASGSSDDGGFAGLRDARPKRQRIGSELTRPVDGSFVAVFRIVFGLVLAWEVWRYLRNDWVARYFIEPEFYFTYYGFDWVQPIGERIYVVFFALGVAALCFAAGFLYRLSALTLFVGWSYVFLLDQTQYLNHLYLICLYCLVFCLVPANRMLALDAHMRPRIRRDWTPAWTLWSVRGLMALVYFYGAVAKWNGDWLSGWPMRLWLADRLDFPLLGGLFGRAETAIFMSWGGMLLDLLVVPGVMWRRTRWLALSTALFFHLLNASMFQIGVFPILGFAATLSFLPPDWPRWIFRLPEPHDPPAPRSRRIGYGERAAVGVLAVFFAFQLLFPLRHVVYPGNVHWTEEGHRFSWHMKLRDKFATARFRLVWPDGAPSEEIFADDYLTRRQARKMRTRPDMILQFAHYLADVHTREGIRPEVRVSVLASLNGRDRQLLIDPERDLASVERTLAHADWVVPLTATRGE